MSQSPTVVLSVILASAAAAGVSFAMRPAPSTPPPSDTAVDLQRDLTALRATCAELQKQLDSVRTMPARASVPASSERTAAAPSEEQLAAAIEAFMTRREAKAPKGATANPDDAFDIAKDFDALVGTNFWENQNRWKKAFAAGRMDEVIARFEDLAKASPNDAQTQMNLASAYLAYMQLEPTKYENSMKADKVLDKVLDLEPTHWEGRFTKAVSYTFWPEFLGKKKDAIAHFETLVKQQETMPVQDDQSQTYLYLGNLLEASDPAKARELWQKGSRRHPNNAELRKKAGL